MASTEDHCGQTILRLHQYHERGMITEEELGTKTVFELISQQADFATVCLWIDRLPEDSIPAASRLACEIADPDSSYILWGIGSAPSDAQRHHAMQVQKPVARHVVEALSRMSN
jgi:hypothetical protein